MFDHFDSAHLAAVRLMKAQVDRINDSFQENPRPLNDVIRDLYKDPEELACLMQIHDMLSPAMLQRNIDYINSK